MTVLRCHALHSNPYLLPLALLLAGCSSGEDFGLVEGYGTINLDSQPLANAQVVFEREDGPIPRGNTA